MRGTFVFDPGRPKTSRDREGAKEKRHLSADRRFAGLPAVAGENYADSADEEKEPNQEEIHRGDAESAEKN